MISPEKRRARLLKEAGVKELLASTLRCEKCGVNVTKEMSECWACGWDKAVDVTQQAAKE
jgi:ribosomal protein L37E